MIKTLLAGIVAEKIYKNPKVKKALDKGFDKSLEVGKQAVTKGKELLENNQESVDKVKSAIKSGVDKVKDLKNTNTVDIKEEDIVESSDKGEKDA